VASAAAPTMQLTLLLLAGLLCQAAPLQPRRQPKLKRSIPVARRHNFFLDPSTGLLDGSLVKEEKARVAAKMASNQAIIAEKQRLQTFAVHNFAAVPHSAFDLSFAAIDGYEALNLTAGVIG
jgi:hypothetical protein